jgi:hypothetical protein
MLDLLLRIAPNSTGMTANLLATLPVQQLKRAVAIRSRIDDLETQLGRIVGAQSRAATDAAPARKRRYSAAARARISSAMKARWAKVQRPKRASSRSLRAAKAPGRRTTKTNKPSPPGQLKEKIIRTLKAAGNPGVTVKDLAAKTGRSYGNISVWFHTTAKGVKEIKKVAPGRFAWAT